MKFIVFLSFLISILSCEKRQPEKRQKNGLGKPLLNQEEVYNRKSDSFGKKEVCKGFPMMHIEICKMGGYENCKSLTGNELPIKKYSCGFGEVKYKNFLCASEHNFTEEDFKSIECEWIEEKSY